MITSFKTQHSTSLVSQAEDFVRELIDSGGLREGEQLPTTRELAMSWGMPVGSVHTALASLVRDGLLVRQPSKGTFVARSKPALTAVAIYEHASQLSNPESNIHRVIIAELQQQLSAVGLEAQVVIDPRPFEEQAQPLEQLVRLSRTHRVGAIIAASAGHLQSPWLSRLPHLAAFGSHDKSVTGQVGTDFDQMAAICLRALAEQGCRSVGLISALQPEALLPDQRRGAEATFFDCFTDLTVDLGLQMRNDWITTSSTGWIDKPSGEQIEPGTFMKRGYEAFHRLWRQKERPDGLVIYPDSFVPGVLMAIAELGVKVPRDLRLAYHRNECTPIFSPFPATEAILSEREIAKALIVQAHRLWRGKPCNPVKIGFRRVDKPAI